MRILSVRRGFLADHSSTSYEFLAVEKPLGARARSEIATLSSRVEPTERHAHFVYHGDFNDLPADWASLMFKHYDVMYKESYDWWTLAIAFNTTDQTLIPRLRQCAFEGADDLGVWVRQEKKGKATRVLVSIECHLDPCMVFDPLDDLHEDEPGDPESDSLFSLLTRIRQRLQKGDSNPLLAVWDEYGLEDEKPPRPRKTKAGVALREELSAILASGS